jgi:sialate O-acetylesterase
LYASHEIGQNRIRIHFDHAASGLYCIGDELTHFTIAGRDSVFVPAKANIEGSSVVVFSEEVPEPIAVRFGWSNTAEPNLFNMEGLPASSFRTDAWPRTVTTKERR